MRGDPIMLGYYKDPEGTAEVIDADGWYHTGDIARVEEDGYMYLTGRKKNVIILDSGENVSPEDVYKRQHQCIHGVLQALVRRLAHEQESSLLAHLGL